MRIAARFAALLLTVSCADAMAQTIQSVTPSSGQQGQHLLLPFAEQSVDLPGPFRQCSIGLSLCLRVVDIGSVRMPRACATPQYRRCRLQSVGHRF